MHFGHPLVSESPSPDTKTRFDYRYFNLTGDEGKQHTIRYSGEYAFTPNLSVEASVPYTYVDPDDAGNEDNLDNSEIALKYANFAFADRGLLLAGGLELGLSTGNDGKGIGSNNVVEVGTFVDFGYKRGAFETVGFFAVGFRANEGPEEADHEYAWNLSFLYHATPRLQALLEFDGETIEGGEEDGFDTANVAPGVKFRPIADSTLTLGASVRLSLEESEREFDAVPQASLFYHY